MSILHLSLSIYIRDGPDSSFAGYPAYRISGHFKNRIPDIHLDIWWVLDNGYPAAYRIFQSSRSIYIYVSIIYLSIYLFKSILHTYKTLPECKYVYFIYCVSFLISLSCFATTSYMDVD